MRPLQKYIGSLERDLADIALEYKNLALDDEEVGKLLMKNNRYKHAVYFYVQAMEKYVRFKIFTLVNANTEYFRNRTRTHNLDELLDFLIEIASTSQIVQQQVRDQLETLVLGGIRFGKLHNDLRYPIYSDKSNSYSLLQVNKTDAEITYEKLQNLKRFVQDIDRLRR